MTNNRGDEPEMDDASVARHGDIRNHLLADIDQELEQAQARINAARERVKAADIKYNQRLRYRGMRRG